ncbi:hypothetical protein F4860DRAFT_522773 [Xylaria cubensis]|nr:hypothetical protein F4860DRAFT_522773 [Xylaria cubensis]
MAESLPTRLIICVDGTWFDPDGGDDKQGNITNIYRLYASVGKGVFQDASGNRLVDWKDNISQLEKLYTGAFGLKCFEQIENVYEECCCLTCPDDEVWLYGFSRGAYVVRAVAGLLHYLRALVSADVANDDNEDFHKDYIQGLKIYEKMQKGSRLEEEGAIHSLFHAKTRKAPIIKFIGAFDTVKAVDDNSLYDISFNESIQHMRAALALNETRRAMKIEGLWPSWGNRTSGLLRRSFIQAWFVGTHIDIGGSAPRDGLSLYPLQWIMLESKALGLVFKFEGGYGGRALLHNPLEVVGIDDSEHSAWSCATENKLVVEMRDICRIHEKGNLYGKRYRVQLNPAKGFLARFQKIRTPFDNVSAGGGLKGYCRFAPQGTIIHPSVYMIIDKYLHASLDRKSFPFYEQVENWREKMMGLEHTIQNQGYWNHREEIVPEDLPAMRILVCGNCGVGKSALINRVFGVEATKTSDRERGIHNVEEEITWKDRPDLIIHDSRGFEAGEVAEFDVVENFLKKKSNETELAQRLHVIWFCIEASSTRMKQASTEKLFQAISKYAEDIPVVVIATKKDNFLSIEEGQARRVFREEGRKVTMEDCEEYAQDKLQDLLQRLQEDINDVKGRFDACVAVSMYDPESITTLSETTLQTFSSETVRMLYVRAQVANIDLKIKYAVGQTMAIYKKIMASAATTAGIPAGPTSNRTTAAVQVCMTVLNCFGLPTINSTTAFEICKINVWDDMKSSLAMAIAEGANAIGLFATIATGGLPFFLIPMATNAPVVLQATSRLFLKLACDLILIFTRAFKETALKCIGQPEKRDVEVAARAYRQHYREVHRAVSKAIPNLLQSFQVGKVTVKIRGLLNNYKHVVTEDFGTPPAGRIRAEFFRRSSSMFSLSDSDTVLGDSSDDIKLVKEAREEAEKLRLTRSKHVYTNFSLPLNSR